MSEKKDFDFMSVFLSGICNRDVTNSIGGRFNC